jgi:hypothetical protein
MTTFLTSYILDAAAVLIAIPVATLSWTSWTHWRRHRGLQFVVLPARGAPARPGLQ